MKKRQKGGDVVCCNCGKSFYVPFCRLNTVKFCSRACLRQHQEKTRTVTIQCVVCGKNFEVPPIRQTRAKYCSHQCYGKALSKQGTVEVICEHCHQPFKTSPSRKQTKKYCSRACAWAAKRRDETRYPTGARLKIKRLGLLDRCHQCGYNAYPEILEIHHIDRNPANNAWNNLAIVCPNCHKAHHYAGIDLVFKTIRDVMIERGIISSTPL